MLLSRKISRSHSKHNTLSTYLLGDGRGHLGYFLSRHAAVSYCALSSCARRFGHGWREDWPALQTDTHSTNRQTYIVRQQRTVDLSKISNEYNIRLAQNAIVERGFQLLKTNNSKYTTYTCIILAAHASTLGLQSDCAQFSHSDDHFRTPVLTIY